MAGTSEDSSAPLPASVEHLVGSKATIVIVGLFLCILMAGMDALVVATALPDIATSLGQTNGITFVVSTYLITSTVSIPIFAKLSDMYSRRDVFLVGLAIFIAGSALAGLSQNLTELIVFRGVQGFGSGAFLPIAIAMISILFPPDARARITGVLTAAGGIAIVVGPLLGSYIVDITTWRWIFYINLPIGIAGMLIVRFALGPLIPSVRGRLDVVGAVGLAGWVSALMIALVEVSGGIWAWTDPITLGLLATAGGVAVFFFWWELHTPEPLLPLRLLRRRVMAADAGATLFNGLVFTSVITLLSVFVGIVLLNSGANAANDVRDVIYFFAVPLIAGAFLAGQLLTRFSYRAVIAPALGVAMLAAFGLATVSASTPLWVFAYGFLPVGGIILPLIPMGFGSGLALTGTIIVVQNEASVPEMGASIGLIRFLQSLGGAVGLSVLTSVQEWRYQSLLPGTPTPDETLSALVNSYDLAFLALAVALAAALAFSLFLRGRVVDPTVNTAPIVPTRSD